MVLEVCWIRFEVCAAWHAWPNPYRQIRWLEKKPLRASNQEHDVGSKWNVHLVDDIPASTRYHLMGAVAEANRVSVEVWRDKDGPQRSRRSRPICTRPLGTCDQERDAAEHFVNLKLCAEKDVTVPLDINRLCRFLMGRLRPGPRYHVTGVHEFGVSIR